MTKPLILYVGSGAFSPGRPLGPALRQGVHYVAIDSLVLETAEQYGAHRAFKAYNKMPQQFKANLSYVKGNGTNMQFPDESVAEVHIYDVLSDPSIREPQSAFLDEALRVLEPGGSLFVGESISLDYHPLEEAIAFAQSRSLEHKIRLHIPRKISIFNNEPSQQRFLIQNVSQLYDKSKSAELHSEKNWDVFIDTQRIRFNDGTYFLQMIK